MIGESIPDYLSKRNLLVYIRECLASGEAWCKTQTVQPVYNSLFLSFASLVRALFLFNQDLTSCSPKVLPTLLGLQASGFTSSRRGEAHLYASFRKSPGIESHWPSWGYGFSHCGCGFGVYETHCSV